MKYDWSTSSYYHELSALKIWLIWIKPFQRYKANKKAYAAAEE